MFLPIYRAWVIAASLIVCLGTWFMIEKTRLGAYLRAATENPPLVQAFGVNVPRMITLTYGFGVGLAGARRRAGGADLSGEPADGHQPDHRGLRRGRDRRHGLDPRFGRHRLRPRPDRGLTKVFWPEASATVIFVIMADRADATRRSLREGSHGMMSHRRADAPSRRQRFLGYSRYAIRRHACPARGVAGAVLPSIPSS
jgi:hypothetical protein